MANKRHIRIKDLRDAKRLLVKLINERRRDETESQEIRDVGYLIRIFVETYTKGELEERLEMLEKAVQEQNNRRVS